MSDWVPHVVDLAGFVVRVASRAKHYVKVGVRVDLIVRVDVSRPVPPVSRSEDGELRPDGVNRT